MLHRQLFAVVCAWATRIEGDVESSILVIICPLPMKGSGLCVVPPLDLPDWSILAQENACWLLVKQAFIATFYVQVAALDTNNHDAEDLWMMLLQCTHKEHPGPGS